MGLAANDTRFIQGKADGVARVRNDILALQAAGLEAEREGPITDESDKTEDVKDQSVGLVR